MKADQIEIEIQDNIHKIKFCETEITRLKKELNLQYLDDKRERIVQIFQYIKDVSDHIYRLSDSSRHFMIIPLFDENLTADQLFKNLYTNSSKFVTRDTKLNIQIGYYVVWWNLFDNRADVKLESYNVDTIDGNSIMKTKRLFQLHTNCRSVTINSKFKKELIRTKTIIHKHTDFLLNAPSGEKTFIMDFISMFVLECTERERKIFKSAKTYNV